MAVSYTFVDAKSTRHQKENERVSDAEIRRKERKAKTGDLNAAAEVERSRTRLGEGVLGFLQELVGKQIYVEGIRINYRGILEDVITYGDGSPAALVGRWQRVSYFEKSGPNGSYTYTHTKPHLIPYEVVHDVGEEGFAEGAWPPLPKV